MKNRKIAALFAALVLVGVLCSCSDITNLRKDDSPKVKVTRAVGSFAGISINGEADVHYRQGDSVSVVVVGRETTVNNLTTEVHDGKLVIEWKNDKLMNKVINRNVDLYIVSPTLNSIAITGCGDFKSEHRIDADTLSVALRGTGDISLVGIVCENIDVNLIGAGDIEIKNIACQSSNFYLKGTGDIEVGLIDVPQTKAELRGVGDVKLKMQNCGSVSCALYGVGDMEVSGSLRKLEKTGSGIGNIETDGVRYIK